MSVCVCRVWLCGAVPVCVQCVRVSVLGVALWRLCRCVEGVTGDPCPLPHRRRAVSVCMCVCLGGKQAAGPHTGSRVQSVSRRARCACRMVRVVSRGRSREETQLGPKGGVPAPRQTSALSQALGHAGTQAAASSSCWPTGCGDRAPGLEAGLAACAQGVLGEGQARGLPRGGSRLTEGAGAPAGQKQLVKRHRAHGGPRGPCV